MKTRLFVPEDVPSITIKYADMFYINIKIVDENICENILGENLKQYVSNLDILFTSAQSVVFRATIIVGFTDAEENLANLCDLVSKYRHVKIELIKEHDLGKNKYISLGKKPLELNSVLYDELERIKLALSNAVSTQIEICKV